MCSLSPPFEPLMSLKTSHFLPWASLPELVATARIAPATAAAEQADEDLDFGAIFNHATGVAPKMGIGCNPQKDGTSSMVQLIPISIGFLNELYCSIF